MAVSAVYVAIAHIASNAAVGRETVRFDNISATTAAFSLSGGQYGMTSVGATFGTITLQVLGEDASTWLTAATAVSANGYATMYLVAGRYRLALA